MPIRGISSRQWVVLFVLWLAYVVNQWDRYLIPYLSSATEPACSDVCRGLVPNLCVACDDNSCQACHECLKKHDARNENMQLDLCISNQEFGILTGFGFTALYVVASVFAGLIGDTHHRRSVLVSAIILWSVAAACQAASTSFATLLAVRGALGIAEAFFLPCAYAIMAEMFAREHQATVFGLFSTAIYSGNALASLSLVIGKQYGWRATCVGVGCLGAAVGIAAGALFLYRPGRTTDPLTIGLESSNRSFHNRLKVYGARYAAALGAIFSHPVSSLLLLASAIRFMGGFTIGAYMAKFYTLTFPDDDSQYSALNAVIIGVGGGTASAAGGFIADRLLRRPAPAASPATASDGTDADEVALLPAQADSEGMPVPSEPWCRSKLMVPVLGSLVGAVAMYGAVLIVPSLAASMGFFALEYLFAEAWFGPTMAVLQQTLSPDRRALGAACFVAITSLVGSAAPPLVGYAWEAYDPTETGAGLGSVVLGGVTVSYLVAALLFLGAAVAQAKRASRASASYT